MDWVKELDKGNIVGVHKKISLGIRLDSMYTRIVHKMYS